MIGMENIQVVRSSVALLTGDVNLRIRAHTADIPTKSIESFCIWAKNNSIL